MVKMLLGGKSSEHGVSSFQAFSMALSGRIGTGNIAGVATAIALGGPGAIFWMWVIAFLGASTAYVESTLGQIYKEKVEGHFRGGPAYYIEKGLGIRWYAILFAIVTVVALGILIPGVQSNTIADSFQTAFGLNKTITAAIVVMLLGLIIFGGVKRIAKFAELVVPFMAAGYMIVAAIILVIYYRQIPELFSLIWRSAIGIDSVMGGIVGSAVMMGVKRGIYSNEAGQGTGPHAAAAAEVSHPANQGLVQAFSIYVDTLLVCTATAFMILITGMYNVYDSAGTVFAQGNEAMVGVVDKGGPIFTQMAVESIFAGFGKVFVAISLFFFAFTTLVSYYFQAETNVFYLLRGRDSRLWVRGLQVVILSATFFTAITTMDRAWDLGDIGIGLMAWINLIAILMLQRPAIVALRDYEKQLRSGVKEPTFDPDKMKIKGADLWTQSSTESPST
jgi:AGCS family alanine or glycine:cation symporter